MRKKTFGEIEERWEARRNHNPDLEDDGEVSSVEDRDRAYDDYLPIEDDMYREPTRWGGLYY